MPIKIVLKGRSIAAQTRDAMDTNLSDIAKATTTAAREAARVILAKGQQDIANAGRFGSRWTTGLKVDVQPKSGALINARITVTHDISYFDIFEEGGTIRGSPLLWIPLSYTGIRISASMFASGFGGLFSVQRNSGGAPLLFSKVDRKPKYFGIPQVTIPKKFHITEICRDVMAQFDKLYSASKGSK
jgi:hypothetical protein